MKVNSGFPVVTYEYVKSKKLEESSSAHFLCRKPQTGTGVLLSDVKRNNSHTKKPKGLGSITYNETDVLSQKQ